MGLLGNTVVFLLTAYEFRTLWRVKPVCLPFLGTLTHLQSSDPLKEAISSSPFLNGVASFLRRLVMLHSQELVLITIVSIAVSPINFAHLILVVMLLVKYPFRSGTSGMLSVIMLIYLGVS